MKKDISLSHIFAELFSFRIDVKNIGNKDNSVLVENAERCKINVPSWIVNERGAGVVISGCYVKKQFMKIKIIKSGLLTIFFRGVDKRFNGERIPLYTDYESIKVDSKEILATSISTWHDEPFKYEMSVKDGQEISLEFEQKYHQYTEDELMDILEKLNLKTDRLVEFLEYYKKNVGFREIKYSWDYVKNKVLSQNPCCVKIDDITERTSGRLQIEIGSTKFESVLIPSKNKKLYVTLGGYNNQVKGDNYPYFSRISWCDKFDGMYLCFDDPTRVEKHFSPSYYFGNKQENYLEYVLKIIERIARVHEISNENIVLIGSSHTAFAILYLGNEISGSKSIALCPQVDVKTLCGDRFSNAMGISYDDPCLNNRLNILRILKNEKSKFFIFSNILCDHDKKQIELLYQAAGKSLSTGLTQLSMTTKCLIAEIPSIHPHWAQPDEYFVSVIEKIMARGKMNDEEAFIYEAFCEEMKRYYALNDKIEKEKQVNKEKTYYIVSGGFDPIHEGHIEMIQCAANVADGVIVLANSDDWLRRKKGKNFYPIKTRRKILENLKGVMDVLEFDDSDNSASDGIRKARSKYPDAHLVFANGGDRNKDNIPESVVCKECGVDLAFGVGGNTKVNSSSWILKKWACEPN